MTKANDRRRFFLDWPFHCPDERTELAACQATGFSKFDLTAIADRSMWDSPDSDPIRDIRTAMEAMLGKNVKTDGGPYTHSFTPKGVMQGLVPHLTIGDEVKQSDQIDALKYAMPMILPNDPTRFTTIIGET